MKTYDPNKCAVIGKTKERWGTLHCMASGMPLVIMGVQAPSAEHVYQCLRTSDAEVQGKIVREPNPFTAKHEIAYKTDPIPQWDRIRVEAMRYVLRAKWHQSARFRKTLEDTMNLDIVERSYKDPFWGAVPNPDTGMLQGENVLGHLLMELRAEVRGQETAYRLNLSAFTWFGRPLVCEFRPETSPDRPALLFEV